MPGEASTLGAGKALDAITGRATQTAQATYLALLSAAPGDADTAGTMAELSTAGYARQEVTWTAPAGDPQSTENTAELTFGPFSADPPNVTHLALVSSASGAGDLLYYWTADTPRDAASGDSISVAAGGVSMSLD